MSYGFSATNNYNQVLISSDTRNLHFIGKAYLYSNIKASDYYGGMRQWSFRIGTAKNIVPLPFFTMTGAEYYGISAVRQISVGNSVILTTAPIPITGQLAKTYTWNSTPLTITEGTDNIYSVTTTNVVNGTTLYWDISPSTSNDFQYTDGSFIIDSTGAGSFQITPTKFFDPYPEAAENYTINIRTYAPLTGTVVLSQTITVNDSTSTDITGFGWTADANWGPNTITEGSSNTGNAPPGAFVITATQGNNPVILTSSPITIAATLQTTATFTFSNIPTTLNEGTSYNITVNSTAFTTRNASTFYWQLLNAANEFSTTWNQLSGTTVGTINLSPTSFYDPFAETNEIYYLVIRPELNSDIVLATSPPLTVRNTTNTTALVGWGWDKNANWGPAYLTEGTVASAIAPDYNTGTLPDNTFLITVKDPENYLHTEVASFPARVQTSSGANSTTIQGITGAYALAEGTRYTYIINRPDLPDGIYRWVLEPDYSSASPVTITPSSSTASTGDFVIYSGSITLASGQASFSFTPLPDAAEPFEYFLIKIYGKISTSFDGTRGLYWHIVTSGTGSTTSGDFVAASGQCIGGGWNWAYFNISAVADLLPEGTERFAVRITNAPSDQYTAPTLITLTTSGFIDVIDTTIPASSIVGPTTVIEGIANTYTAYTSGLSDGTYYWRINDVTTSTTQGITPTSTGDFTTSWGTVSIVNNTGTFSITPNSDSITENDETFTISLVNKAAADKYWTVNPISPTTTNDFPLASLSGQCIPGGYNWWYFNVNAVADSQTEGTEKFSIQIRQDSTTGTVLTTSGAISITDNSVGGNYAVLPASTQEAVNFNITIFTPGIADGTNLYWNINHITTSDLDFVTTFGSFAASTTGAIITLNTINYDASELDEGFTISVSTQPKYIWEVELIRSGVSNTVPEVYVFAQPDAAPLSLTETMGLKVMRDDGTPSFDSRLGPLVISAATAVTQPFNPRPTAGGGLNAEECHSNGQAAGDALSPDLTNYNAYNITGIPTKPIYHYTSLAQAQRQTNAHRDRVECFGFYAFGSCQGYEEVQRWNSNYWCFYRGGIKNYGNTQIHAGWIPIIWNCYWDYYANNNLVGFGVGSDGNQGGGWPYNNDTINLSAGVVIVSDGALYD